MAKYCVKCGNPVEPGSNFCTKCGAKIYELEYEKNQKSTSSEEVCNNAEEWTQPSYKSKEGGKKRNLPIILVCTLIFIAVIIAIVAIILSNSKPEEEINTDIIYDSSSDSVDEESLVGEAVTGIIWYHTIETEDGIGTEHFTFRFGDDGILNFKYWKDETSFTLEGDSLEYFFAETEEDDVWILEYSGYIIYEDDTQSGEDYYSGKIECEYDENKGIITMIPLEDDILCDYSESDPFVVSSDESDELSFEYDYHEQTGNDESLDYSEAQSISSQVLSDYIDAYIDDFNNGQYNCLESVVEDGSNFENDKIEWIKKCDFLEEITDYNLDSVSVINQNCIQATSTETYYVYGIEGKEDYYLTQRATYIINKQSNGEWKISDYKGNVETLNKEYA